MTSGGTPSEIVAERIQQVRTRRGMLARDLATRCTELGLPLTAATISNIETGRRQNGRRRRHVTVDELLVFATALNVSPVDLLVPPDAGLTPYSYTPVRSEAAREVRDWIRGLRVLPGGDVRLHLTETPPEDYYEQDGLLFPRWKREPEDSDG